jgi:hypothetical protein
MTLIDLKLSDPNYALRSIMNGILDVTGICGEAGDLDPTVANVRHAAVTLWEIADGQNEAKDVDALRGVLSDVCRLRNDGSIVDLFPDGTDDDDCPPTPANLRFAGRVLWHVAAVHDDVAA